MRKERRHGRSEGRGEVGSERRREGATELGRGAREERGGKGDRGREGNFKGATLRNTQNNTQRGPCHCDFGITNTKL